MSKKITLNVLGDSYTTPGMCVNPADSFWGLVARDLDAEYINNYSYPGFSLDHVMHIILNEEFDFGNDYFILGIPPLPRYAAYSDLFDTNWDLTRFDSKMTQTKIRINSLSNTNKFTFEQQFLNDRAGVDRFSAEWHEVHSIEKIYLIHQWLLSQNAKFMIVNLSKPMSYQDSWPAGKNIITKAKNLQECVLFDNTYYSVNYDAQIKPMDYDQYGYYGHHGAEGNLNWYKKVIHPKIIELGWINA